ncbi:hypothetical protein JRI60_34420 [Archangium violaceum]|uniref:hypothetical protein n=1 Tax=Archangium violaceum TaxID=83451 RepID=UPI00194FD830|nr:hypothetical protein [Archangium violaceum]QRN94210.1 hypothetical protein JRI60_34420 [Archangium violaceum]
MSTASRLGPRSTRVGRQLGLGVCLLFAVLLSGCPKPQIHRFTTMPPVACPGDEVTLHWETNGAVRLSATPDVAALGAKDDAGKQTVTVSGPTRFRLEVSRVFGLKKEMTESEVLSPPKDLEYGIVDAEGEGHFTCSAELGGLESSFQLDGAHISPNVRIGQVRNMNVRALVIRKGEVSETVGEGAAAPGFEGQPAQGLWQLRVPLEEGESCEDALESVDGRLIIKLQLSCPR